MFKFYKMLLLIASSFFIVAQVQAVTDTIQAPTGFFVPTDAQKNSDPYYRWYNQDWGWVHNPIVGSITSASLNISAFDVDAPSEVDNVYANDSGSWVLLGSLAGADNIWAFTSFALGANFFDDINSGLQVKIDIDTTHDSNFWAVALAKSSLSTDGSPLPDPIPGIPEPESYVMLLAGLGLLGFMARRKKQTEA